MNEQHISYIKSEKNLYICLSYQYVHISDIQMFTITHSIICMCGALDMFIDAVQRSRTTFGKMISWS